MALSPEDRGAAYGAPADPLTADVVGAARERNAADRQSHYVRSV